jgi:hypothetical protein
LLSHLCHARRPGGRCRRQVAEESPGSTGMRCRLTAGGGDPRESATENIPPVRPLGPAGKGEMVRQERTAPPVTGVAGQTPPGARPNRGGRRRGTKPHFLPWPRRHSRLAARVGRARRAVRRVPEEWPSRAHGDNPRTRTETGLQAVWRPCSPDRSPLIRRLIHVTWPGELVTARCTPVVGGGPRAQALWNRPGGG